MDNNASETDSVEANFDTDSVVDLESLMESDDNRVSDVSNFDWENYPLPESIDDLRAKLLTPVGLPTNSPTNSPHHVPANYRPDTTIYSPTSPDYSPSISSVHVYTDNTDNLNPTS